MRLLKHRHRKLDAMDSLVVPGLKSEPTPDDQALAWAIVQEIEAREGLPLAQLTPSRADDYVREIYDVVQWKTQQEYRSGPEDVERAERILEHMRRMPIHRVEAEQARPA